jgi:hypothetical protein
MEIEPSQVEVEGIVEAAVVPIAACLPLDLQVVAKNSEAVP